MRRADKQPPKTKKYFRSTKSGAGMTKAGVARGCGAIMSDRRKKTKIV